MYINTYINKPIICSITHRNPGFDRKCLLGDGCWYCCHKCDICMLDATAGFSFQTRSEGAQDAKSTLRFHDEKCKAFSDCSHDYPSSFSLQEPVKEITFHLLPYYNSEELIGEVKCMHLLSAKLSYYDQRKHHPICASVDIYRVKKGNDRLLSGCLIALFDMRTYSSRTFGEFFLTDEFRLDKPLPHVNTIVDTEKIKVVNDIIHEVILKSGHDVKYFRSLGTQAANSIPPLVQENVDDCNEFIGLDFS